MTSVYRHIEHAAHYGGTHYGTRARDGHDLDEWDVTCEHLPTPCEAGIPLDAKYHHGYRDSDGRQHRVFTRIAPFSAAVRCERCPA